MPEYYIGTLACTSDFLAHHGIKGQKWGVRRYQNPDGTLTPAGRARYRTAEDLGYTPYREKSRFSRYEGDRVQQKIARVTNKYLKKEDEQGEKVQEIVRRAMKENRQLTEKDNKKLLKAGIKGVRYAEAANFGKEMQKTYASMSDDQRRKVRGANMVANAGRTAAYLVGGIPLVIGASILNSVAGTGKVATATYDRLAKEGNYIDNKTHRKNYTRYVVDTF